MYYSVLLFLFIFTCVTTIYFLTWNIPLSERVKNSQRLEKEPCKFFFSEIKTSLEVSITLVVVSAIIPILLHLLK